MKKLFCLILVLIMIPTSCFAIRSVLEFTDFIEALPDLSDSSLTWLNEKVQALLFERGLASGGVCVPQGVYTVGVDIPEGTYRIEFENKTGFQVCGFSVYNSSGSAVFGTVLGYGQSDTIGKISLIDGYIIEILYDEVVFFTYTGLFH